ncbi:MAG: hypothetical protein GWO08_03135 [Gammaproteobacteria bacterium]|nr:hypothetical protein [Gammaproteobacteria bacterium]
MAERLDTLKLFDAVEEMTVLNIHRGGDAYGFMMQYNQFVGKEGSQARTYWYKDEGDGQDVKSDAVRMYADYGIERSPNIVGVHTRAKSTGFSEKDNDNNHPVVWENVLTTHNGMLRNHYEIKNLAKKKVPSQKVDSLGISAALSLLDNPEEEFDKLGDILPRFEGGWAFHSIWSTAPGYSLLVAGPRYPLVIWTKAGITAYSSEFEAIDSAFNVLGEKFPATREPRKLKPGQFVLVKDGKPVRFGEYDLERKEYRKRFGHANTYSQVNNKYRRWLPHSKEWVQSQQYRAGVTNGDKEDKVFTSTDHSYEADEFAMVYSAEEGVVNADRIHKLLPASYNSNSPRFEDGMSFAPFVRWKTVFENFVEADRVYLGRKNGSPNTYVYGFFGSVEMVYTDTNAPVGVYNWANGMDRPVYMRPHEIEAEEAEQKKKQDNVPYRGIIHAGGKFTSWLKDNSLEITDKLIGEKVIGCDDKSCDTEEGGQGKVGSRSELQTTLGMTSGIDNIPYLYMADPDVVDWMNPLAVEDIDNFLTYHMSPTHTIPFLWDEECPRHGQMLATHSSPFECDAVTLAAAVTCSWFETLDTWRRVFPTLSLGYSKIDGNYCKSNDHLWEPTVVNMYPVNGNVVELLEEEKCEKCGCEREIYQYPPIIRKFIDLYEGQVVTSGGGK